eukprot:TRINITY_DN14281_c0_g1_i1.p1 TRINITY_DN14281_c0_g1~~TRINITY_DN14281_c0_g1_i1.p1  ORF type:complete len:102 (+),score=25.61 TRINITY_DN14281_c0_g1_i1:145-450(+)
MKTAVETNSNKYSEASKKNAKKKAVGRQGALEKEAGIQKDNQKLLDRLMEISEGKAAARKSMIPKTEPKNQPKSLNYSNRRDNMVKIQKENSAMVRRLIER